MEGIKRSKEGELLEEVDEPCSFTIFKYLQSVGDHVTGVIITDNYHGRVGPAAIHADTEDEGRYSVQARP